MWDKWPQVVKDTAYVRTWNDKGGWRKCTDTYRGPLRDDVRVRMEDAGWKAKDPVMSQPEGTQSEETKQIEKKGVYAALCAVRAKQLAVEKPLADEYATALALVELRRQDKISTLIESKDATFTLWIPKFGTILESKLTQWNSLRYIRQSRHL